MPEPTPEFLTVPELASLLRIKERKVYDLAASGEVPCSRATGKLLFPERAVRAWIAGTSTGPEIAPVRPTVFLGSHDPLLDWALRQSRCGIASYFDSSLDGLDRLEAGEGIAAGIHIRDMKAGAWNIPAVADRFGGQGLVLVGWVERRRGLILPQALKGRVSELADLPGHRFAARQPESGTASLFAGLLAEADVAPSQITVSVTARSEQEAVLAVAQGQAEATFGLEPLAAPFGLVFVPLIAERFDLLVDRKAWFEAPFQTFLAFCRSGAFADHAATLAGYDTSELGQVRWNG